MKLYSDPAIPGVHISAFLLLGVIFIVLGGKFQMYFKDSTTLLKGPVNPSFLFGFYRQINEAEDPGIIYDEWAAEYGPAFHVPGGFGSSRIVICDPKANAHFYSKETFGYIQTKLSRVFIENLVRISIVFYWFCLSVID